MSALNSISPKKAKNAGTYVLMCLFVVYCFVLVSVATTVFIVDGNAVKFAVFFKLFSYSHCF